MQLKNCHWCGKVFAHSTDTVCQDCCKQEEKDFDRVFEFLKNKKNATIDEVYEETGVEKRRIIKFIRQGRLLTASGEPFDIFVECEKCGAPIREGRLCDSCAKTIREELKSPFKKEKEKEESRREFKKSGQMYTADRRTKKSD